MYGSRPDLFQLRLLFLGAMITAGAIAIVAMEFDDKTLFTTSDETFAGAGRISLWTKADSVMRVEQIAIDVLP